MSTPRRRTPSKRDATPVAAERPWAVFTLCRLRGGASVKAKICAVAILASALLAAGCSPTPPPEPREAAANCEQIPEGRWLDVAGLRLRYAELGQGNPPVVLLHGNGATIEDFAISGVFAAAARHHRVVAFDRPGWGGSERPRDRSWTPGEQATLLAEAFARLGIERPVVVGHSSGTLVALALALDHPDAVGGLVLVSGYYYPTGRADLRLMAPLVAPVLGDVLRHTVAPAAGAVVAPAMIRQMFAPVPVPACFTVQFPLAWSLSPLSERASAEESLLMDPSVAALAPRYRELRLPIVIVTGAEDRMVDPGRQSARLHQDLPGSVLAIVPGQGHMVHHGAPQAVADAIDDVAKRRHGRGTMAPISNDPTVRLPGVAP